MPKHIVIIEDDPEILYIITQILEEHEYRVTGFNALSSSIEELGALKADCFIFDEQLPYVSGHIICIMIKSHPLTMSIPVILISASDKLEGFVSIGDADASLKKPFNIDDLVTLVGSMFR